MRCAADGRACVCVCLAGCSRSAGLVTALRSVRARASDADAVPRCRDAAKPAATLRTNSGNGAAAAAAAAAAVGPLSAGRHRPSAALVPRRPLWRPPPSAQTAPRRDETRRRAPAGAAAAAAAASSPPAGARGSGQEDKAGQAVFLVPLRPACLPVTWMVPCGDPGM